MSGRQPLVLCIENELGGSGHKTLLERHGYQVITVTSDREGFSVLRKNPVDAIIVDLEAAGMGRGTAVRRLKDIKPHVPVLLVHSAASIPPGRFPAADAVVLRNDAPARLLEVLDYLLNVRFPFFARWFGNWKHRDSA
ncbi:MAG: response regulator [Acidobacteriia bacterium]|nr:response regulator [Terriglobia bacterium]